jgi:hypothetical protein
MQALRFDGFDFASGCRELPASLPGRTSKQYLTNANDFH